MLLCPYQPLPPAPFLTLIPNLHKRSELHQLIGIFVQHATVET